MLNTRNFLVSLISVLLLTTFAFSQAEGEAPTEDPAPAIETGSQKPASPEPELPEPGHGTIDLLVVDSPSFFPCPIRLPEGFDPEKEYPLVIGLHGYAANSERYLSNWFAFDDPQFIYACPQAMYPVPMEYWLGYSWFLIETGDRELEIEAIGLAADYVLEVKSRLLARYNISEVYLLGFSQGAQMSFKLGIENPSQFAGVGCIAGKLKTAWLAKGSLDNAAGNLRVFMAHGTEDQEVDIAFSYIAQDILAGKGYDVSLTATADGHTFSAETLRLFQGWLENAGHGF